MLDPLVIFLKSCTNRKFLSFQQVDWVSYVRAMIVEAFMFVTDCFTALAKLFVWRIHPLCTWDHQVVFYGHSIWTLLSLILNMQVWICMFPMKHGNLWMISPQKAAKGLLDFQKSMHEHRQPMRIVWCQLWFETKSGYCYLQAIRANLEPCSLKLIATALWYSPCWWRRAVSVQILYLAECTQAIASQSLWHDGNGAEVLQISERYPGQQLCMQPIREENLCTLELPQHKLSRPCPQKGRDKSPGQIAVLGSLLHNHPTSLWPVSTTVLTSKFRATLAGSAARWLLADQGWDWEIGYKRISRY